MVKTMTRLPPGGRAAVEGKPRGAPVPAHPPPRPERRPYPLSALVLVLGLTVTVTLSLISLSVYRDNEQRLLGLRAREAGAALNEALAAVQTPLTSAVELARATDGSPAKLEQFLAPYTGAGSIFVTATLWRLGPGGPVLLAREGTAPNLVGTSDSGTGFFAALAGAAGRPRVTGIIGRTHPRVGYGLASLGAPTYVVYVETPLPPHRRLTLARSSAFSDLNYAFYLGPRARPADLLATSATRLPFTGRTASSVLDFGAGRFTLVMSPIGSLSGTVFQRLPWAILLAGVLLSLAASWLTERLVRGRRLAEGMATRMDTIAVENLQLYAEQRTIAETLQHALLPEELPALDVLQTEVRYLPGVEGVEVGGDWYELLPLDERRLLFVVGDVSGRGLRAATIMASLRHSVIAFASQGDPPEVILTKLSQLADLDPQGERFATVMCSIVDLSTRILTVANAGHPPPLLVTGEGARFLHVGTGLPIGVDARAPYERVTIDLPARSTLLAYTDGLVERRGECIDTGLERLRLAAEGRGVPGAVPLGVLMTGLVDQLVPPLSEDDAAIVGLRWRP